MSDFDDNPIATQWYKKWLDAKLEARHWERMFVEAADMIDGQVVTIGALRETVISLKAERDSLRAEIARCRGSLGRH